MSQGTPGPEGDAAQRPANAQVEVNDSAVNPLYSNFCRVTGTPEELIIDFGLNPQPVGPPTAPINVSQRIIVNFWTAKRLLHALGMALQRHEAVFGALETDIMVPPMVRMAAVRVVGVLALAIGVNAVANPVATKATRTDRRRRVGDMDFTGGWLERLRALKQIPCRAATGVTRTVSYPAVPECAWR